MPEDGRKSENARKLEGGEKPVYGGDIARDQFAPGASGLLPPKAGIFAGVVTLQGPISRQSCCQPSPRPPPGMAQRS